MVSAGTWTTYGTWLPGDERGFVSPKFEEGLPEERHNTPETPYDAGRTDLLRVAAGKLAGNPIWLTGEQAGVVRQQFEQTATYRGWRIIAGAIMSNHVHLVVTADKGPKIVRDQFKANATRVLREQPNPIMQENVWTRGGDCDLVDGEDELERVILQQQQELSAVCTQLADLKSGSAQSEKG